MTYKKVKTVLFASLIAAMILPFSMGDTATAQVTNDTVIDKAEEPTEFVGTLKEEIRQIGSYLLVKHTYTSDDLNLKNVDHIYREEIVPVDSSITQQEIDDKVNNPKVNTSHEMIIVHEDETAKIDKIRAGLDTISAETFQQWNVVGMPDNSVSVTSPVLYTSSIKPISTTIEDWASTQDGYVYTSHDPINLIWKDTQPSSQGKLLPKVDTKINQDWDGSCLSSDLYINISGTWTKQDKHFIDNTGGICNQYHVRAWEINDNLVIGSAHKELLYYKHYWEKVDYKHKRSSGTTWDRNVPTDVGFYHALTGFDTAEDHAAGEFSGGCWSVTKDSYNLNNKYTRETYKDNVLQTTAKNDGKATEILCS